jgi:hypothetical protein
VPAKKGDQTIDQLLYQCTLLETHREGTLEETHHEQRKIACKQTGFSIKTKNSFIKFINSIHFDQL